jgi:hypothetical protein
MAGHLLGVLKPSVVLQADRDAGRPPNVTSDGGEKTRGLSDALVAQVGALYGHFHERRLRVIEAGQSASGYA